MIEVNSTIIWQFANFVVLMLILNVVLYRPLRNMLQKRDETVNGAHQKAGDLEKQIAEKMTRYQEQLQDAKQKAGQERAALREEAAREEGEILAGARETASKSVQQVKSQVAADAEAAASTLKEETRAMAGMIAAKVLGREV